MIAERIPVRQFSPLLLNLLVSSKKELEAPYWNSGSCISGNQPGSHEPPTHGPSHEEKRIGADQRGSSVGVEHFIFVVGGMSDLVWVRISPPPNFWRYIKFCSPIYNSVRFFP